MNWSIHSQSEFESAMLLYFSTLQTAQAGTLNAMLCPEYVSSSYAEHSLTVRMRVENWMLNPVSHLHGGISAAVLDFTMGVLSRVCSGGGMTPTITLHIEYLRSLGPGDTLVVRAQASKTGRSLERLTALAWNESDPDALVLTASGSYFAR